MGKKTHKQSPENPGTIPQKFVYVFFSSVVFAYEVGGLQTAQKDRKVKVTQKSPHRVAPPDSKVTQK